MDTEYAKLGPFTNSIRKTFKFFIKLSIINWLSNIKSLNHLRPRSELTKSEIDDPSFTEKRLIGIEKYMLSMLAFDLFCVLITFLKIDNEFVYWIIQGYIALRILEIIQVTLNTSLFDELNGRQDRRVASNTRMVLLAGINFIQLAICFGVIYALNLQNLSNSDNFPGNAYYFSIITQLTIGFGDICPTKWLRIIVPIHGMISLVFLALVFARFVSSLPRNKDGSD